MTETTDPLRALARETIHKLVKSVKFMPMTGDIDIVEAALGQAQALQREADAQENRRLTVLLDVYEIEQQKLHAQLKSLEPYLQHKDGCPLAKTTNGSYWNKARQVSCTCGLATLRR